MSDRDIFKEILEAKQELEKNGKQEISAWIIPEWYLEHLKKDDRFIEEKSEKERNLCGRIGDLKIYTQTITAGPYEILAQIQGVTK